MTCRYCTKLSHKSLQMAREIATVDGTRASTAVADGVGNSVEKQPGLILSFFFFGACFSKQELRHQHKKKVLSYSLSLVYMCISTWFQSLSSFT